MVAGCSSMGQIQTQMLKPLHADTLPETELGWWRARFHILWGAAEAPSWNVDLILAHQIVLPILQQHKNAIVLWRFHRRAARDEHGHRFSFIFYASPATAFDIFHAFMNDPLLDRLKFTGLITRTVYDDPSVLAKPNIEDTTDRHWSDIVRRTWPYYIMGVSRMWLNMVSEIAVLQPDGDNISTISELMAFYQGVNTTLSQMWAEEGRHAYLHHLNALFGYEPLIYYEKKMLIF
jgi:hypothetical protein